MRRQIWWAGVLLAAAGCEVRYPEQYPASRYSYRQLGLNPGGGVSVDAPWPAPPVAADAVAGWLHEQFGGPGQPARAGAGADENAQLGRGAKLFHVHCLHCHGLNGGGNGPTAAHLLPRPRDLRRGVFKWKSTFREKKPTRDDLLRTLREGAPGTSMPDFHLLPDADLEALADYVMFLSTRGEVEHRLYVFLGGELEGLSDPNAATEAAGQVAEQAAASLALVYEEWAAATRHVVQPATPQRDFAQPALLEASIQNGKRLYLSDGAACAKCHGADGAADPAKLAPAEKAQMVDLWGFPNYPRNLHLGLYRGGRRPADLYRRVQQGVAGAAMPAAPKLAPEEIWDIVNFVRALPTRPDLLAGPTAAGKPGPLAALAAP